jgi:hypothetical protein
MQFQHLLRGSRHSHQGHIALIEGPLLLSTPLPSFDDCPTFAADDNSRPTADEQNSATLAS